MVGNVLKLINKVLSVVFVLGCGYSPLSNAGLVELGIDFNQAERYTFAVGNHGSLLLGSEAYVYGHVAAEFFVQLASGAQVRGDACANGSVSLGSNASVSGDTGNTGNCADLTELTASIQAANALAASWSGVRLNDVFSSQILAAQNSQIFEIDDLNLETGEFLTISGDIDDTVVVNVAGDASIGSGAGIVLDGGILGENVLFNFLDTQAVSNFEFGGAELSGSFLANNRSFQLGDGAILKDVRFYNNASMQANVQVVNNPPIVTVAEPKTFWLFLYALIALTMGISVRRGLWGRTATN